MKFIEEITKNLEERALTILITKKTGIGTIALIREKLFPFFNWTEVVSFVWDWTKEPIFSKYGEKDLLVIFEIEKANIECKENVFNFLKENSCNKIIVLPIEAVELRYELEQVFNQYGIKFKQVVRED